jgi:hypothetical protein
VAQTATHEIAVPVQRSVVELKATVADEARATADGLAAYSSHLLEDLKTGMGTFWSRLASGLESDDKNEPSANDESQDGDGK